MRRALLVVLVLAVLVTVVVLVLRPSASSDLDPSAAVPPVSHAATAEESPLAETAEVGVVPNARSTATEPELAPPLEDVEVQPGAVRITVRVRSRDDGAPVRAGITVWPDTEEMNRVFAQGMLATTGSTTDERGEMVIELPAAARYRVRAFSPTRSSGKDEAAIGPWKPGERVEVELRVATKPDLVFCARVVDERGIAIAGAHVSLISVHDPSRRALPMPAEDLRVARSDANGAFVVELMSWRTVSMLVEAEGYSVVTVVPDRGHETFEHAFEIPLLRSGTIAFRASGRAGVGLAGAIVRLECESQDTVLEDAEIAENVRLGLLPPLSWTATLDERGECTLRDVPVRRPLAMSLHEGVFERRQEPRLGSLEPGETRAIHWRIGGGCRVTGEVVDQDGKPLAGQDVWLLPDLESSLPTIDRSKSAQLVDRAITDASGRFQLDDVSAGKWIVGPPYCAGGPCDFYPLATRLEVPDGVDAVHVVVRVWRGLFVTGRVEDPDGRPLRGVRVEILGLLDARESSGTGGVFRLGPLPPLEGVRIRAECVACPFAEPEPILVDVPGAPEIVVVRMRRGGSIAGVVRDATGEDFVVNVVALPIEPGIPHRASANARGNPVTFVVERLLPGRYLVRAETDDGRIGQVAEVRLAEAESIEDVVVTVRAGATLHLGGAGVDGERRIEVVVDGVTWSECWILPEQESSEMRLPHGPVKLRMTDDASGALLGEQELVLKPGEIRTIEVARIGR